MWNVFLDSAPGPGRPPMQSKHFSTLASLKGLLGAPVAPHSPEKQFPSFINRANPYTHSPNRTTNVIRPPPPETRPPETEAQPPRSPVPNKRAAATMPTCLATKKKNRRRRRNKKKKNAQTGSEPIPIPSFGRAPGIFDDGSSDDEVFFGSPGALRPPRQRTLSSTDSEDSFVICFDENDGEGERMTGLPPREAVAEGSSGSDDSFVLFCDEGRDEGDGPEQHLDTVSEEESDDMGSCESVVPKKKVRFVEDSLLCEVHPMVKWSYAYQAARKGPWEEYARDRDRFKLRISRTELSMGEVLAPGHRARIYEERFRNSVPPPDH